MNAHLPTNADSRLPHYDMLRGLAVSIMLPANASAYIYTEAPPLAMKFVDSLAAPCFTLLVGMMLALSSKAKFLRGAFILMIGVLIDVFIWKIVPFVTFDILYFIGAAIIITTYPARAFSIKTLWISGVLIFLVGQFLQAWLGYGSEVFEISLPPQDGLPQVGAILSRVARQFFIDGWFPLLPWLGFVWLGAALQRSLMDEESSGFIEKQKILVLGGLILSLAVSAGYWSLSFVVPEPRMGYTELFYPPSLGYCFTYFSLSCLLLFLLKEAVQWTPALYILSPFMKIGQNSLLMYVIHLLAIQLLLYKEVKTGEFSDFLSVIFAVWIVLATIAYIVSWLVQYKAKRSFSIKSNK